VQTTSQIINFHSYVELCVPIDNSGFIRFNGQNNSTKTHCYLWSNFHLTLKNIFDKQPDVKKYFDKRTAARHKICSKLESKFTTGTRWCYLQIVIVHVGVRESQPGFRKVKSRSGVCYFFKFLWRQNTS
jgi:hypothetical protein